jgi:hypothetical protein
MNQTFIARQYNIVSSSRKSKYKTLKCNVLYDEKKIKFSVNKLCADHQLIINPLKQGV